MIDKILYFVQQKIDLSEQDEELFRYGLESLICDCSDFFAVILISLFLHDLFNAVVYIVLFSVLRVYTGGWHAMTKKRCLCVYIVLYLVYYITRSNLHSSLIYGLGYAAGSIYTCFEAPVEHIYAPLEYAEHKKNHNAAVFIIGLYTMLSVICFSRFNTIFRTICLVTIINACLMETLKHTAYWRQT